MTYCITLSTSELNLIGAALHRLPPEQIVLIENLRRQAEQQEAVAQAAREAEQAAANFAAADAKAAST
jgi:hypothetical protein